MKDTITISIEKDLKQEFVTFAKSLGTNPTNLLCMIMKDTIKKREVTFGNTMSSFEIEPFSEEEIKGFSENFIKKTNTNTKKMENLLAHI